MHPPSKRFGHTPSAQPFAVPLTSDMFQTLVSPSRWGPAEVLTLFLMLVQLALFLFRSYLPTSLFVFTFVFWRLCYNLGLAALLRTQSEHASITNWLQSASPPLRSLVRWFSTKSMSQDYDWYTVPVCFNAWLAFRSLSMIVLSNDGLSYIIVCLVFFTPLSSSSFMQLAISIPLGLSLVALSVWSKAAAHNVLGDFAWYWGDFFFTMDGDLVFDGVFEIFPHPMYTVGYAAYYGLTLICRSYPLLMLSLLAHVSQLLFLFFVEEPHIQKIYAPKPTPEITPPPSPPASQSPPPTAAVAKTYSASPSDHMNEFLSTIPQPPVIIVLAVLVATVLALSGTGTRSKSATIILLLVWRVGHWLGCAILLRKDASGRDNLWMRWSLSHGSSRVQAYSSWQHIYLFSYFMNHTLFLVVALTTSATPKQSWLALLSARTFSYMLGGTSLIAVALVSVASTWSSIGYFGFYYGDFFVSPPSKELVYNGVFRYVNNPECILGHLAYYGLAIVKESWTLFFLAFVCQAMNMMFVRCVEMMHIEREYQFVRKSTALESSVEKMPVVGAIACNVRQGVGKTTNHVQKCVVSSATKTIEGLAVRRERMGADFGKVSQSMWDHQLVRQVMGMKNKMTSLVGSMDWDNVVSMLERHGIVVDRVVDGDTD